MNARSALLSAALLLVTPVAAIAAPLRLTVDDAVARARAGGEEVRVAHARVLEARGRVREALANVFPQVNGKVRYARLFDSIYEGLGDDVGGDLANSPFAAANSWNAEVTATQALWDFKIGAGLKAAKFFKQAAQHNERETTGDLVYRVKQAYYDAASAERLLHIAEFGRDQSKAHENQVALFQREGTRAEYDLLRAQVDAANQEPIVVAARNARELAHLELKRLANIPLEMEIELEPALEPADGQLPALAEAATDLGPRGSLEAANATIQLQRQAVRVRAYQDWPSLSASTTISHQAFPEDEFPGRDEFRRNWEASVELSVPIFQGFRNHGAADRERALLQEAVAEYDRLKEAVALEGARARAELARTQALLSARRETVRRATRAFELAGVRYANGLSTQLEVSDTRLEMQTAEVDQVEATRDYLTAIAGLERALGRPVKTEKKPIEQITLNLPKEGATR